MSHSGLDLKINISYTRSGFNRAWRYHYSKLLNLKKNFLLAIIFAFCAFWIHFYLGVNLFGVTLSVFSVLFLGLPMFSLYILPEIKYREMEKNPITSLLVSVKGIAIVRQDKVEQKTWKDFIDVKENEEAFLVYSGNNDFLYVPKNNFKDLNEQVAFRKYLQGRFRRLV